MRSSIIGKPIEIHDLAKDSGEQNDLAKQKPELVEKAKAIFDESYAPHPDWPLDRARTEKQERAHKEA